MTGRSSAEVEVVDTSEAPVGTVPELRIMVADPHSANTWRCAAEFTVPPEPRLTLLICVHGGTYNRWYWNPDERPDEHSFVQLAARRGYATINVDRIGYGRSDHPDGDAISLELHAAPINAITRAARTGLLGQQFGRVVGVGHSVGTYVLMTALNGAHALDAAVLTGITHLRTDADPVTVNVAAADEENFSGRNTAGYSALPTAMRAQFYHLPTTTPEMVAADARAGDVVGSGDLVGIPGLVTEPCRAAVPLCLALAEEDWLFVAEDTAQFRQSESAWYPAAPSIDFRFYEDTGHNINLHAAGPRAMSEYLDWIDTHG